MTRRQRRMTRRQRHLLPVDGHLDDLLARIRHRGNPCQVCAGFKSLDKRTVDVTNEMKKMQSTRYRLDAGKLGK